MSERIVYLTCAKCSNNTLRYSSTIDGLRCQSCGTSYINCEQVGKREDQLQNANDNLFKIARKYCVENKTLKQALKVYARRNNKDGKCWNWHQSVCDSYSGESSHFDWKGDEQDEPWEVAERALAGVSPDTLEPIPEKVMAMLIYIKKTLASIPTSLGLRYEIDLLDKLIWGQEQTNKNDDTKQ